VSQGSAPRISVLVPTYNWSSALGVALASIQAQTFDDFEVLVVGDACTDDSEQVVAALGDDRFSWHNLEQNCGSQWGPNNRGLELARGEYVAYLGHDDLWWPTHLALAHRTFEETGADVVAAATLMYGPPESGVRAVAGLFPHGEYSPRIFFPPSSMVHRKDLAVRIGGWHPPEQCEVAVDFDFLVRCHAAGARFAATGEFTAFKFTAGWRRDTYRLRDASQQKAFLARMRQDGERFRLQELSAALHAAAEARLCLPTAAGQDIVANVRQFKGTKGIKGRESEPPAGTWIDGKLRFAPRDDYQGFEWHALEEQPGVGKYRWSGPSTRSSIVLPVTIDRPLEITLLVVGWISDAILQSAKLHSNDVAIDARLTAHGTGRFLWRGSVQPGQLAAEGRGDLRITLTVDRTHRPFDLGLGDDQRWLGLAVAWVEVGGLTPP
jgi:hypothetical protein